MLTPLRSVAESGSHSKVLGNIEVFVDEESSVSTIVEHGVRARVRWKGEGTENEPLVLLDRITIPVEHGRRRLVSF